jgi:hypothetical protein
MMKRIGCLALVALAAMFAPAGAAHSADCYEASQSLDTGSASALACPEQTYGSYDAATGTSRHYTRGWGTAGLSYKNVDVHDDARAESYSSSVAGCTASGAGWDATNYLNGSPTVPGWPLVPYGHGSSFYGAGAGVGQEQRLRPGCGVVHETWIGGGGGIVAVRQPGGEFDTRNADVSVTQTDRRGSCETVVTTNTNTGSGPQHSDTPLADCPAQVPQLPVSYP